MKQLIGVLLELRTRRSSQSSQGLLSSAVVSRSPMTVTWPRPSPETHTKQNYGMSNSLVESDTPIPIVRSMSGPETRDFFTHVITRR